MKQYILLAFCSVTITMTACKKNGGGLNIFSLEDDKALGLQVKEEIASKPGEYPILSRATYANAYNYLDNMRDDILNSGQVTHRSDFVWELFLIKDDNVQNAFCTPGGYIYIYTGLIKYLDDKSALAGVLGHEIAHADKRHSTEQLTKVYGVSTLLSVVTGTDDNTLAQIATGIASLSFSRANETEADKFSVVYLCPTKYVADGAAHFFQKIIAGGGSSTPEFLSTHPNPDNRVENIQQEKINGGCQSTISTQEDINEYNSFKASL